MADVLFNVLTMRFYLISFALVSLCFAGCTPKHHTATVKIQLVVPSEERVQSGREMNSIGPAINVNANSSILASNGMIVKVAQRLRSEGIEQDFVAPYKETATEENVRAILKRNRWIESDQEKQILELGYAHPEPKIAVAVGNIYAETFVDFLVELKMKSLGVAVEGLDVRAEQQKDRIQALKEKLEAFKLEHDIAEEGLESREEALGKELTRLMREGLSSEKAEVAKIEQELIELSKIRVERNSLLRDLEVQESFYDALLRRQATELKQLEQGLQPNAVILERAVLSSD